jgi:hypothetical protein
VEARECGADFRGVRARCLADGVGFLGDIGVNGEGCICGECLAIIVESTREHISGSR